MDFNFLLGDTGFMLIAMAVVPWLVGAVSEWVPGRWTTLNRPSIAVMAGAILGIGYYLSLRSGLLPNGDLHTWLEYLIAGAIAGSAASGATAVIKDARDGSLTGRRS